MKRGRREFSSDLVATRMGLVLEAAGINGLKSGQVHMPKCRTLKSFAAVYLCSGRGIFESALTRRTEVIAGTLFFLFPGVGHRYGPVNGGPWREHWVIFSGFLPEVYRERGLLDPAQPFRWMGKDRSLERQWYRLFQEQRGTAVASAMLFSLLSRVLTGSARSFSEDPRREACESALKIMARHLSDPDFRLEDHVGHLPISYSALRRQLKTMTGLSPARYLVSMRMQAARSRLLDTDDAVKQIAMDVGFIDPYHFSRRFKEVVGVSPERFRRGFTSTGKGGR